MYIPTPPTTTPVIPDTPTGVTNRIRITNVSGSTIVLYLDGDRQGLRPNNTITVTIDINKTNLNGLDASGLIRIQELD